MAKYKKYRLEVVNDDPSKGLVFEDYVMIDEIKSKLAELVPECDFDFDRLHNDDRVKLFKHYMPANETVADRAYRRNNELFKNGNNVKFYLGAVVF